MLHDCFPDVLYQGIYSFLDMENQLSVKLCVPNDKIHLGARGIAKLVTYMKTCVFRREKYDIFKGISSKGSKSFSQIQESTPKVGSHDPS